MTSFGVDICSKMTFIYFLHHNMCPSIYNLTVVTSTHCQPRSPSVQPLVLLSQKNLQWQESLAGHVSRLFFFFGAAGFYTHHHRRRQGYDTPCLDENMMVTYCLALLLSWKQWVTSHLAFIVMLFHEDDVNGDDTPSFPVISKSDVRCCAWVAMETRALVTPRLDFRLSQSV